MVVGINRGDTVTIDALGTRVTGEVVSVEYYEDYQNGGGYWDIEMKNANVPGGYSHWKQKHDGGELVSVNGEPVKKNIKKVLKRG